MSESDDSDKENFDAVQKYRKRADELIKEWNTLLNECNEDPIYVTENKLTKMKNLSSRLDKKCEKMKKFRIEYYKNPKIYGKEIEKRVKDVLEIIKELTNIRNSIHRKRDEAEAAPSTDDDCDLSSVTAYTYIESSSDNEHDTELMDFEETDCQLAYYIYRK